MVKKLLISALFAFSVFSCMAKPGEVISNTIHTYQIF
jgi:hypothetical protein